MKLTLLILILTLIGCNSRTVDRTNSGAIGQQDSLKLNESQNEMTSESFETDKDCVIFLMPSDSEIAKMQKENSDEDYNEIIFDMMWYPDIASEYLDSLGIKNTIVDNQKLLVFKRINGEPIKFQKDEINGDMILFRKDTLPIIGYAIDFNKDFARNFFRKNN